MIAKNKATSDGCIVISDPVTLKILKTLKFSKGTLYSYSDQFSAVGYSYNLDHRYCPSIAGSSRLTGSLFSDTDGNSKRVNFCIYWITTLGSRRPDAFY